MKEKLTKEYRSYIDHPERYGYEQLTELIDKLSEEHRKYGEKWFSPNHNLEIYLYEYWVNQEEYECTSYQLNVLYKRQGVAEEKRGMFEKAEQSFLSALEWNPVDIEIYLNLCENYVKRMEWFVLKEIVRKMYHYCYTCVDLSRYYRYLGRYFLEIYQPEISACLYRYSNYWYQTKTADKELDFLKAATADVFADHTLEEDKKLLLEHDIPLRPEAETLALCYHAAKEEKDSEIQKLYFSMLYQVTGDVEIEKILINRKDKRNPKLLLPE